MRGDPRYLTMVSLNRNCKNTTVKAGLGRESNK